MGVNSNDILFISGMYKSGTSWLLRILGEHPNVRGYNEINILKGIWYSKFGIMIPKSVLHRAESLLGSPSYSRVDKTLIKQLVKSQDIELFLSQIPQSSDESKVLKNFIDLPKIKQRKICELLLFQRDNKKFLKEFLDVHREDGELTLFKSADIMHQFQPIEHAVGSRRQIVVVRDGRDVSVSAVHFLMLMKRRVAPWYLTMFYSKYVLKFRVWNQRVTKLIALMSENHDMLVIRYEDLLSNFEDTISKVFDYCNLSYSDDLIKELKYKTSFKKLSGREPGHEQMNIMRKGVIADWKNKLTRREIKACDAIGQKTLSYFDYFE